MKTIKLIIGIILGMITMCYGQNHPSLEIQKTAMRKLAMIEGQWKGTGWIMTQQGKKSFRQTEHVQFMTDGVTMQVIGKGVDSLDNVIHDAFGLFFYNAEKGKYEFQTHISKGYHTVAEAGFEEEKFIWSFQNPYAGTMRYTIWVNEKGQWVEIGEMSRDGTNWFQFFAMKLDRV